MKHKKIHVAATLSALMLGCAADPGTKPHDMSAPQHEAAADQEMRVAAGHQDQYDPNATKESSQCAPYTGCWTSRSNPTAQHGEDAQRHRELAGKHRAASAALADAESRACSGISDEDRDMSPFNRREDIQSVSPLKKEVRVGKGVTYRETGVTVVFRAVPGLTAEWLQRVINCHLARAAAVGHDMPEMSYCPLVPKGVEAKVTSAGDGFAVNISAEDQATIDEIKRRAQALSVR